jgi:C1A family cysteine protease
MFLSRWLPIQYHKPKPLGHYGCIPDQIDHRDRIYKVPSKIAKKAPVSVDLSQWNSPVRDQGDEGACTGFGITAHLEWLENRDHKADSTWSVHLMSPQFLYYQERVLENTVYSDSGAQIRDGIKVCAKTGCASEDMWPYSRPMTQKPCPQAYADASQHQILTYHRLQTLQDALGCLGEGYPFVLGIAVYESFESDAVIKSGQVPMPEPGERLLGGHCIFGCGCDVVKQQIKVKNSWGPDAGDKGYFYLPFDYVAKYANDMWTIRTGEEM